MLHFGAGTLYIAATVREVSDQSPRVIAGEYRDAEYTFVVHPVEHLEQIYPLAGPTTHDRFGEPEVVVYNEFDLKGIATGGYMLADVGNLTNAHEAACFGTLWTLA